MLTEFSIIPIGIGSSIGDQIAEVLKIVDASGLPYRINPMGTVVEGEWDDIMKLIKKCHETVLKTGERVITTISIDDRKGKPNRIKEKIKSIERRIGKSLKK
ncbi:MAG: MTH1187 family thiamine-binding protein [Nitrospira sp.]|nr:MTH1187 family thiamine-binding protein [Nitrospira sp.]